jgi:hypothetical protein
MIAAANLCTISKAVAQNVGGNTSERRWGTVAPGSQSAWDHRSLLRFQFNNSDKAVLVPHEGSERQGSVHALAGLICGRNTFPSSFTHSSNVTVW